MTTNRDWLFSLPLDEQIAWMNAEHQDGTLDGDTAAENADSRELILTDLEKKTREWHDYDGNFMRIYSDVAYAQIKELLDRQAAITHREVLCQPDERDEQIAELTAEVKRWANAANGQRIVAMAQADKVQELTAERDKAREESVELYSDLVKASDERERYRSKFGKCLDYADAIHALMDEGMA